MFTARFVHLQEPAQPFYQEAKHGGLHGRNIGGLIGELAGIRMEETA